MRNFKQVFAAFTVFGIAFAGQPLQANEVWDSATGKIVYEDDVGGDAIFSFTSYNGSKAFLVVEDFDPIPDTRGTNQGYWIGEDGVDCGATLSHSGGYSGTKWGKAVVVWDKKAYPTGFMMTTGDCFGEPEVTLHATPNMDY